jgi:hypothetical protein
MKKLHIIKAGSHIASNSLLYNLEEVKIVFIDRDPEKIGTLFCSKKIIGPVETLLEIKEPINVVIGAAFQSIKKRVYSKLSDINNVSFPFLIAKNAWIS